ncbi:MAG: flagellar motor switch protein FliM [Gammaproteobacteria bacterium]
MDNDETVSEQVDSEAAASGEVLSEEEKDALMAGVSSGEVDGQPAAPSGEVVPYDLTSQDRIVRGRLPVLEKINERFIRYLQGGFEKMLKRPVDVSGGELQTVRISDYIHGLDIPASLNFVHVEPLPGEALFVFNPHLVYSVVDIYFGGNCQQQGRVEGRDFTPTETRVTRLVLDGIFQALKDAWEQVLAVEFNYVKSESNPQFSCMATSREMMVVSGFHVKFGEVGGEFHVCFPYSMIDPVRGLLDGGRQKSRLDIEKMWLTGLKRKVQEATVEMHGTIADTEVSLRDIFNLKAGDVIPVTMPEQVTLTVDDVHMFHGHFGVHNGHNAVKIISRLNTREER